MNQTSLTTACMAILLGTAVPSPAVADDQLAADKAALAALQKYVGGWRGVGQPRRGSSQGAWSETADWSWRFAKGRAMLVFESPKGKYYRSGKLLPASEQGSFKLAAVQADESGEDHFSGKLSDTGELVLIRIGDDGQPGTADRISMRMVADGDRLLMLYERHAAADRYTRLAEVGYTRSGASFAKGSGAPECVVTGGVGTIAVEYQGKKYFVCCTGCRDLFNDDPASVLAEFQARKAAEKKKQAAK